jgi:hypothetical protein
MAEVGPSEKYSNCFYVKQGDKVLWVPKKELGTFREALNTSLNGNYYVDYQGGRTQHKQDWSGNTEGVEIKPASTWGDNIELSIGETKSLVQSIENIAVREATIQKGLEKLADQ